MKEKSSDRRFPASFFFGNGISQSCGREGRFFSRADGPSGDRLARVIGSSGVFTGFSHPWKLEFSVVASVWWLFQRFYRPSLRVLRRRCWILYRDGSGSSSMSNDSICTSLCWNISAENEPFQRGGNELLKFASEFLSILRRQIHGGWFTSRLRATVPTFSFSPPGERNEQNHRGFKNPWIK